MVACERGYLCDVCGAEVEGLSDSDLYLRYILGLVRPETLHSTAERHLRCNPVLAQFIVDPRFEPVRAAGPFAKEHLDAAYVAEQEELVSRAWRRLIELPALGLPIIEYPLPEVRAAWLETLTAAEHRPAGGAAESDQAAVPDGR